MAKKGKQRTAGRKEDRASAKGEWSKSSAGKTLDAPVGPIPSVPNPLTSLPCDPPRRHRWLMIASFAGVLGWMLFMLVMAVRGH